MTLNWFKNLSYDNQVSEFEPCDGVNVTARYHGGSSKEVYYTIEIISDKGENEAVEITYSDGYTGKFYCSTAASGNGVGVIELSSVYKTGRYSTSDLVEVLTTDENGLATSKELPLGKYIVRELTAPDGYITDPEGREVELKYKNQFTPLIWGKTVVRNEAVSVEIDLEKVFETAYESGVFYPSDGAKFGVYTGEKISAMNPAGNLKKSAEKGTLIDIFEVDSKGKSVSKVKLPEGTYYVKEIATKAGYVLNDMPFYFKVSESKEVTSAPVDFSYAADGISGDIVMDSYGVAVVRFDTLTRYPMPTFTVNGRTYKLDESRADDNVSVTVEKDRARAAVTVNNGQTADITLPNGVPVTVTADGNVYNYSINGAGNTFIPAISHTGYRADFSNEFRPLTKPDFSAETEDITFKGTGEGVLKAAVTHTPVTYEEVITPGIDLDGDGLYDKPGETPPVTKTKGKLDAKGKQIYTHKAAFTVEDAAGNSIITYIARNGIEETITDPVSMADGDKIIVKDSENTQFSVQLSEGNIYISANSIIKGAIAGINKPAATVNGGFAGDRIKLFKNITLARADHKANTIQIKINAEEIDVKGIENNKDKPEIPYTPVTPPDNPKEPEPEIRTTAKDSETGDHISFADEKVTIIDTVSYKNLTAGREYTLKGVLMDKATGKALTDRKGKEITAEKTFTPEKADGTIDIAFTFNGKALAGKSIVVFERLYHEGKETASHTDIEDMEQSIHFPEIKTKAALTAKNEITDIISYKNLLKGKTYMAVGVLMDKAKGKALKGSDGKEITAVKIFTAEKSSGSVSVTFSIPERDYRGKDIVVYESLQLDGSIVGEHKDLTDKDQTVHIKKKYGRIELDFSGDKDKDEDGDVPTVPKTGDDTHLWRSLLIALISFAAMAAIIAASIISKRRRKARGKNEEA